MRAPFQGRLPGPVKYGYLNVGVVDRGPAALVGRTVFCLYPHQTEYVVPAGGDRRRAGAVPVTGRCWPARWRRPSTRCGTPRPLVGDRVAVVGAGMIGCCVARLLARLPGVEVSLVDVDLVRALRSLTRLVWGSRSRGTPRRAGPRGARERDLRRAPAVAGPARPGGHRPRPQLVRRHRGAALARWRVPLGTARHPGEPGRPGGGPTTGTVGHRGPAGAGPRSAPRRRVRRAPDGRVSRSPTCPR